MSNASKVLRRFEYVIDHDEKAKTTFVVLKGPDRRVIAARWRWSRYGAQGSFRAAQLERIRLEKLIRSADYDAE